MGGPPAPAWAPPRVHALASRSLGGRYDRKRCAKLWGSLVTAFGDDKLALRALHRDPTVLDPSNDPLAFGRCKAALIATLGSVDAATDAMLQNPALLRRDVRRLSRRQIGQQAAISAVRRADGPIAAAVLCAAAAFYYNYLGAYA